MMSMVKIFEVLHIGTAFDTLTLCKVKTNGCSTMRYIQAKYKKQNFRPVFNKKISFVSLYF